VNGMSRQQILFCALAVTLGVTMYLIPFQGLSEAGRITLGIFTMAAVLWVTEAIPLFATSFAIVLAEVVFLGLPGGPLGLTGSQYSMFLTPFFDPIIALFLGGFVLGIAMNRYNLDQRMARLILDRVGDRPEMILAGFMAATAFLSMWLSNTATTALMIAVLLPVLRTIPKDDPFRKALILGIPFAANIGGMGTPVGTPPNAIAMAGLARIGIHVSFLQWMVLAVPLMLLVMVITWEALILFFRPRTKVMRLQVAASGTMGTKQKIVVGTFLVTVLLWLTPALHGVPEGIVALIPVVVFFGMRVLQSEDLKDISWDVLFIVAGGISLGVAMQQSGLSQWIVAQVNLAGLQFFAVLLALGAMAALMTTFISNSATANLLIPIITGLAAISPLPVTVAVALAASLAMALPISTPPNAIAYGSGEIRVADMARVGAIITVIGVVGVAITGITYWTLLGFR
jgi:solute carrier family 13 (sodium-dependent dicarboxylate transporter), member 2/3/5